MSFKNRTTLIALAGTTIFLGGLLSSMIHVDRLIVECDQKTAEAHAQRKPGQTFVEHRTEIDLIFVSWSGPCGGHCE